jgi:hypothetical protein
MAIFKSKLLDLKTDLTTLKYSMDRPDGGTSGQPFIKSPMPAQATNLQNDRYVLNRSTKPFQTLDGVQVPLAASVDLERVTAFMNSSKGRDFVDKQKSLQLRNPITEVGVQINGAVLDGDLEYTRIFNKGNLLLQTKYNGSGYHFDRAGNIARTPFQAKYEYVVSNKDTQENRLVFLYNTKIQETRRIRYTDLNAQTLDTLNNLGISRQPGILFDYPGGPNSSDLNPNTVIKRTTDTTTWSKVELRARPKTLELNRVYDGVEGYVNLSGATSASLIPRLNAILAYYASDFIVGGQALYTFNLPTGVTQQGSNQITVKRYTDNTLSAKEIPDTKDVGTTAEINQAKSLSYYNILTRKRNMVQSITPDFRKEISGSTSTSDYEGIIGEGYLASKRGLGNPGAKNIQRTQYNLTGTGSNDQGVDKINAAEIGSTPIETDMIKCQISAMENSAEADGSITVVPVTMTFRAYITNFTDNHNATYTAHQYVGRGENFYTYGNSTRKIGFTLTIAASSRAEMKPLYRKLNYLVSQIYPGYASTGISTGTGFMRSPLVKMTIGDYLANQPGFIDSISIGIPEEAPWEVKFDPQGVDSDMYQLPQILTLAIQFTPIHNFLARRSYKMEGQYEITPFITPNEASSGAGTKNKFGI